LFYDGQLPDSHIISISEEGKEYKFQTGLVEDFWQGFANSAGCNLHLEIIRGRSDHHKIEAMFKAAARAIRIACEIDERSKDTIPSTKGSLPGFDTPSVLV